ncbi:MAG: 23S rRNA (guanosine(2251)-2'-O)-methyltransferase RlmB [Alphaproteobacteria bacterium]|nr:23S rRNA (guanosine(2251)-2'-O)-methyltransferase RlmB [Alphaproteobacteria bacterium]
MSSHRRSHNRKPATRQGSWIYGLHAVKAALANPRRRCRRLVAIKEVAQTSLATDAPKCEYLSRAALNEILPLGAVHQGIAGLFDPLPPVALDDLLADLSEVERCALMVLDQVSDPRNVGAILRTAAAFGCQGVVVQDRHSPALTGTLQKAASGGLEVVPIVRVTNLARAIDAMRSADIWCIGFDVADNEPLSKSRLADRVAFVLGAEGQGLRRLTRERCDQLLRIPIGPAVESLNVSAAAAIALYEWARPT